MPQPSMQPALPWDLRHIRQHSPTVERLSSHLPHFPEPQGEMGLAGWRRPASDHALPVNLRADTVFSSYRLPVAHLSFECLPAVLAKSRGAEMLPFKTFGICVMSQAPPPDAS